MHEDLSIYDVHRYELHRVVWAWLAHNPCSFRHLFDHSDDDDVLVGGHGCTCHQYL